jgi:hypothetical protein
MNARKVYISVAEVNFHIVRMLPLHFFHNIRLQVRIEIISFDSILEEKKLIKSSYNAEIRRRPNNRHPHGLGYVGQSSTNWQQYHCRLQKRSIQGP